MFDEFLFQYRKLASAMALLFCAYVAFSLWFLVPFTDFVLFWRPDDRLIVSEVPETSLAAPYLEAADIVLAIDGRPVYRSATIYTEWRKPSYEYTIQRGDQVLVTAVPFATGQTSMGLFFRLPTLILALAFLITGVFVVRSAQEGNAVALRVAYIYLLSAVSLMSLQGELMSVTGSWLGRLLWFPTIVSVLYLGFVPHITPLSLNIGKFFRYALAAAATLALISFLEGAVLFPRHTSFDRLLGFGPYTLSLLSSSFAWTAVLLTLVARAFSASTLPYEQQQIRILLFFLGLAIVPISFLTLIPRAVLDIVLLPFPIAIALFVLVPAGFFFVIFRRGFLELDPVFSKTAVFLSTAFILLTLYGAGLYFIIPQFDYGADLILPATLLFLPILVLARYVNQPVDDWISRLLYGPVTANRSLPEFVTTLRARPELTTLESIVNRVAVDFKLPHLLLVLANEDSEMTSVAQINVNGWEPEEAIGFETFYKPLLRSDLSLKASHPLFAKYPWLELLIPVILRHEQIGFMATSRSRDGFFNAEQVTFLSRVADIIAVGSEAIFLFEASRKLSLQLLSAQEMERKNLAVQIHDRPLQMITFVHHSLRSILANPTNCRPEAAEILLGQSQSLQQAMNELRQICAGLYPPAIDQGLDLVVVEVASHFEQTFGLQIDRAVELPLNAPSTPEIATVVYRVLTESLNNIVKHSQTCQASITLTYRNAHLLLVVADQGVGGPMPMLSIAELTRRQHMGIRGMQEWARLVNGRLLLEHNLPQGIKVILEIPNE
jgi:signal transduction histidine kinase